MDILAGWDVDASQTQENDTKHYNWTVEKPEADGRIELSSTGFVGGFLSCGGDGELVPTVVKDIENTRNTDLMFMSWSYSYNNETTNKTGIVKSDNEVFREKNNVSAPKIKNNEVQKGSYFLCLSEPAPGFMLDLNDEPAQGASRQDRISAVHSTSSDAKHVEITPAAKSYVDIKTMLSSVK